VSNKDRIGDMLLGEGEHCPLCKGPLVDSGIERFMDGTPVKRCYSPECNPLGALARKLAAAESKIAALKVDLAAMQKQRDEQAAAANDYYTQRNAVEHERDAALADLSRVKSENIAMKTGHSEAMNREQAKLTRALAALRSIRNNMVDETEATHAWIVATNETIDAVIASPESTAAVEACGRANDVCRHAAEWVDNVTDNGSDQPLIDAVNAWRAGGKDGAA
jgi:hypothetical protein